MRAFLVGALLLIGCSQADNQQFLPIGTTCTESGQCGTKPYFCRTSGYPGGYCEKPCTGDGDCVSDSVCANAACRRKCVDNSQCRANEGYVCKSIPNVTTTVCDVSQSTGGGVDLGATDL